MSANFKCVDDVIWDMSWIYECLSEIITRAEQATCDLRLHHSGNLTGTI